MQLYCLLSELHQSKPDFIIVIIKLQQFIHSYNNETCAVDGNCNSTSPLYFKPILKPETPVWYYPVFYTLGIIHLILALWMVLQYYVKHWTNIRFEIIPVKKIM